MQPLQHQMMGYDRAITMFSPDGRLLQVEYAKKTVRQGSVAIGISCTDGVVLVADKRIMDTLIVPESVEKIWQIDGHIIAAASGIISDARVLIDRAQLKAQGANAIDVGEVCTDATYFASGYWDKPAVMFTASHNPPHYNGLKFSKAGAVPINQDTGLLAMKKIIEKGKFKQISKTKGKIIKKDILSEYVRHVHSFIDTRKLNKLRIAVDAGNGMAGKIIPLVYKGLPVEIVPLFFELDGNFPNHLADPSKTENLVWLEDAVKKYKCDFGMAFDGDADRIFFVDEKGKNINSSLITSLIAKTMLVKHPRSAILHNVVCGHAVRETIKKYGGKPIIERVGHSFIKATMRKKNAIFGGEHSAHYYYRDNYFADSGIISSLIICEVISNEGIKLSELLDEFRLFATLEETNVPVDNKDAIIKRIRDAFSKGEKKPLSLSELDGLTMEFSDWWFNVRPSNTEPLLRLNMEAKTSQMLEKRRKELLFLMKK